jgi:hypothetical protein
MNLLNNIYVISWAMAGWFNIGNRVVPLTNRRFSLLKHRSG